MTDRPILFSGAMIRALIDGRKTQTRRVIDFPGIDKVIDFVRVAFDKDTGTPIYEMKDGCGQFVTRPAGKHLVDYHYSPRFSVGDRLWVRESIDKMCDTPEHDVCYMADWQGDARGLGWRPSIHMPRWASRLTLTVTEVRIQRLQQISEEDAQAEGCIKLKVTGRAAEFTGSQYLGIHWPSCRAWYRELWDSLNAARGFGWDTNPWVVAVTFAVEHRNIDAVEDASSEVPAL